MRWKTDAAPTEKHNTKKETESNYYTKRRETPASKMTNTLTANTFPVDVPRHTREGVALRSRARQRIAAVAAPAEAAVGQDCNTQHKRTEGGGVGWREGGGEVERGMSELPQVTAVSPSLSLHTSLECKHHLERGLHSAPRAKVLL